MTLYYKIIDPFICVVHWRNMDCASTTTSLMCLAILFQVLRLVYLVRLASISAWCLATNSFWR